MAFELKKIDAWLLDACEYYQGHLYKDGDTNVTKRICLTFLYKRIYKGCEEVCIGYYYMSYNKDHMNIIRISENIDTPAKIYENGVMWINNQSSTIVDILLHNYQSLFEYGVPTTNYIKVDYDKIKNYVENMEYPQNLDKDYDKNVKKKKIDIEIFK